MEKIMDSEAVYSVERIQRTNIAEQTFDSLYNMIVTGTWPDNTRIPPEAELCELLGVSRISVRSAIQKMTALGLLEARQGAGTFVRHFSLGEYLQNAVPLIMKSESPGDLAQFREAIESAAVNLAIEHYRTEEIDHLEQLFYISNEAFLNRDSARYTDNDFQFHRYLCSMSHNNILLIMWDTFAKPLAASIKNNVEFVWHSEKEVEDHHLYLVHAIREKDRMKAQTNLHIILNGLIY